MEIHKRERMTENTEYKQLLGTRRNQSVNREGNSSNANIDKWEKVKSPYISKIIYPSIRK